MQRNTHLRLWKTAVKTLFLQVSATCNTVSFYYKEPLKSPVIQAKQKEELSADISGTYKDDDSK